MIFVVVVILMLLFFNGTSHNFVVGHFTLYKMNLLLYSTIQQILWKITMQPVLQSVTTKIKDWFSSLGKIWPFCDSFGRVVQLISHSCVDLSVATSGRVTFTGLFVRQIL